MKRNKKNLALIIAGIIGIGGGITYYSVADHSPYGRKDHFPDSFYGRLLRPEQLHPSLSKAYMEGYAQEDLIINVLDGDIKNIKPLLPQIR